MKLQYKLALPIFAVGISFLVTIAVSYYLHNRAFAIEHAHHTLHLLADERTRDLEILLQEKVKMAVALAAAPLLTEILLSSNRELQFLDDTERQKLIADWNNRWMQTRDVNDAFVQAYMQNPTARYLRNHQHTIPDEYGEIFLTNRYGVAVAATTKLTTLAHAHKYWWLASYYEGKGRIFFDDRGFDESVKDYVLGIVVPVKHENQVIGLLKCNLKMKSALHYITTILKEENVISFKIVRSGGAVVMESGKEPLSSVLSSALVAQIQHDDALKIVQMDETEQVIAYSSVPFTENSEKYGFGGYQESIDQVQGNNGESWLILVSTDLKSILATVTRTTHWIIGSGILFTLLMAIVAVLVGKKIVLSIVQLTHYAQEIGKGHFRAEITIPTKDELEILAHSLNEMAISLNRTTISRDLLIAEFAKRLAVEDALRESEARYRTLIETIPYGIQETDVNGMITFVNAAYAEMLGCEPQKLIGKMTWELCELGAKQEGLRHYLIRIVKERPAHPLHVTINHAMNDQLLDVLVNWNYKRNEQQHVVGFIAVITDITELNRTEARLRQLFRAVEQSPSVVLITDIHANIEYVNPKFTEITGYTFAEVKGKNPRILKSGDMPLKVYQQLWETITTGGKWRGEFRNRKKNGELYWERASISPIINDEGAITNYLAVKEDITAHKRIEKELEEERCNLEHIVALRTQELRFSLTELEETNLRLQQANRAKSQFLSSISHELRTPLNAILGFTDLLAEQFFGALNEKQISYVKQIDNSGKHLLSLINDLLDIAKIDSGAIELELSETLPADFIQATLTMMAVQFNRKKIKVDIVIDANLKTLWVDMRKCKQIMLNLLSNAFKYTPMDGQVTIHALQATDTHIKVEVSDTGIGIEESEQEKIFSEFHQANRVRDEQLGGTGIGLALTRRLVELHGGQIGVTSQVGTGSTFWFTLPFKPISRKNHAHQNETFPALLPSSEQAFLLPNPTGRRILVAEDNESSLSMILDMLSIYDHKISIARNGQEAIDLALSSKPELILMDMRMPILDGLQATEKLRAMKEFAKVPIIALTAATGAEAEEHQATVGCTEHLAKPIQSQQLLEVCRRYLH